MGTTVVIDDPHNSSPAADDGTEAGAARIARAGRWPAADLLLGLLAAGLVTAILVVVHGLSFRTLVSAHGLMHSAVADRFAAGAPVQFPPRNPFFAGEPLPYYWVFHYLAGGLSRVLGVHPLVAFKVLIIAGAWLIWATATALGRRLYGSGLRGLAIGVLVFAGANAIGPWVLGTRVVTGGAHLPADRGDYLWGIAHPIVGRLGLEDPFSLYQPLFFFFFNITSRPVALALVFAAAAALFAWLRTGRKRAAAGLMLATAAATALSPLIGGAAAGALVCGLLVAWLFQRGAPAGSSPQAWPERHLHAAAAIGLGVLLAAPTGYHLVGLGGGIELAPSWSAAIAVASGALVLAGLTTVAVFRAAGPWRRYLVVLAVAATVLLLASVVLVLPAGNSTNFYHAAMVLLPIAAVGAFVPAGSDAGTTRTRAGWGLLLLLPAPAILVFGFLDRPAVPLELEGATLHRTPAQAPLALLYRWAKQTEPDAVFVTDPRPPIMTAVGNMPELPALTGRDLFTAHASSYMVAPNADARQRHEIALRLVEGAALEPSERALIARLDRPLYIVSVRAGEPGLLDALQARHGPPRFRSGDVAVFRFAE